MRFKLILIVIGVCFLISGTMPAQTWSPLKQLTYTGGGGWDPAIAVDTIEGVYLAFTRDAASYMDIFCKGSLAWGNTWLPPDRLSWATGQCENPDIVVDSTGRRHVVWMDYTPSPLENIEIIYKHSALAAPWSPPVRVTWTAVGSVSPALAVDSNDTIHLVWEETMGGNSEIFYKNTTDSGISWSVSKRLTWNSDYSSSPAIAVDSNDYIHIVWANGLGTKTLLCHKVSKDGGNTWSNLKRLTYLTYTVLRPDIAADSTGGIHVVWSQQYSGINDVTYKCSTNGGTTWQLPQRLTWTSGYAVNAKIAVDLSGGIHICYIDDTPGNNEIFYKESTDTGTTWLPPVRVTWNNVSWTHDNQIAVDKNNSVHIVWQNSTWNPANFEIFYKKRAAAPWL